MSDIKNKLNSLVNEAIDVIRTATSKAGSQNVSDKTPAVLNSKTIGKKREQASIDVADKISDEDVKREIEHFNMTQEEKREEISKFIRSEKLDSYTDENYYENIKKLLVELVNRKSELLDNIISTIRLYNGGKREEEWINSNSITSRHAKAAFGGGGGGGNIDDLYLSIAIPYDIDSLQSDDQYNQIKGSIINALKAPQHILHYFLSGKNAPAEVSMISSDEDYEKALTNIQSIIALQSFPKNKVKSFQRQIDRIKNAYDQNGLNAKLQTSIGGKTKLVTLPQYIQEILKSAQSQTITEAIAPESPQTAKNTVSRYYTWLSNPKNAYHKTFIKARKEIETLVELMKKFEINDSLILGLTNKLKKLDNLKQSPDQLKVAAPEILADIDDFFIVLDDEDFAKLQEKYNRIEQISCITESKNTEIEPKRQREVSEKFRLTEIWKQNQSKILKKQVTQEQPKKEMPDIHLGSLS